MADNNKKLNYDIIQLLIYGYLKHLTSTQPPNDIIVLIYKFFPSISIIINTGSHSIKAGIAGEDERKIYVPPVVGINQNNDQTKDIYIGDEINANSKLLLKYPMKSGIISDWDNMQKLLNHTFYNKLHLNPSGSNVLLTEPPLNPSANREKITQIMFEKYNVSKFYLATDAVLSLYAAGRTTGIVVDCGHSVCHTVPIYEGYKLSMAISRLNIGGNDLTKHLMKLLADKGISVTSDVACDIKERLCYIALNVDGFNGDMANYKLPDGKIITLNNERFIVPEILFKPSIIGNGSDGIHRLLWTSFRKPDIDIQSYFYGNIVIAGGSTKFDGFKDRLAKEISYLKPAGYKLKITVSEQRPYSSWRGGSILASLDTFEDMWITKEEYDKEGSSIVHKKCTI